jgi:hypothetical protein
MASVVLLLFNFITLLYLYLCSSDYLISCSIAPIDQETFFIVSFLLLVLNFVFISSVYIKILSFLVTGPLPFTWN